MGSTLIGRGTKFCDNVTVGHGAKIGAHGLIVAQVGIAGSVTLGHHVTLAGQVGVAGHLKVGNYVTAAAKAGIIGDVPDKTAVMGFPAMPLAAARRVFAVTRNLPELHERVKRLERQLADPERARDDAAEDA
jgi:UDP-3-O-[3-hydroxymyristoyl] glucosamine N-acyltransferase